MTTTSTCLVISFVCVLAAMLMCFLLAVGCRRHSGSLGHVFGWGELAQGAAAHVEVANLRLTTLVKVRVAGAESEPRGSSELLEYFVARWRVQIRSAWGRQLTERPVFRVLEDPPECPSLMSVALARMYDLLAHGRVERDALRWPLGLGTVMDLALVTPVCRDGRGIDGAAELTSDLECLGFLESAAWQLRQEAELKALGLTDGVPRTRLLPPRRLPRCRLVRRLVRVWTTLARREPILGPTAVETEPVNCPLHAEDGVLQIGRERVTSGFAICWFRAAFALQKAAEAQRRPSSGKPRRLSPRQDTRTPALDGLPHVRWHTFDVDIGWEPVGVQGNSASLEGTLLAMLLFLATAEIARTSLAWAVVAGLLVQCGSLIVRGGRGQRRASGTPGPRLAVLLFVAAVSVRLAAIPPTALEAAWWIPEGLCTGGRGWCAPIEQAWAVAHRCVIPVAWATYGMSVLASFLFVGAEWVSRAKTAVVVAGAGLFQLAGKALCELPSLPLAVTLPVSHAMLIEVVNPGIQPGNSPLVSVLQTAASLHGLFWFVTCCPVFWLGVWLPLCVIRGPDKQAHGSCGWRSGHVFVGPLRMVLMPLCLYVSYCVLSVVFWHVCEWAAALQG